MNRCVWHYFLLCKCSFFKWPNIGQIILPKMATLKNEISNILFKLTNFFVIFIEHLRRLDPKKLF